MNPDHKEDKEEIIAKIKELPIKERVKAVALYHHLQRKEKLDSELEAKMQEMQRNFDKLCIPIYEKQNEIISGLRAPVPEELVESDKYVNDTEKQQLLELNNNEGIKDYWYKAIKTSEVISDICSENDKDWEVLEFVSRVQLILEDGSSDFSLKFTFRENEYFSNTELTKKFIFKKGEEEPIKSESTQIDWKEGKNVTVKKVTKKQKNKKTGAQRNVTKDVEAPSFFNLFKDFDLSNEEALDEEEQAKEEEKMQTDFDIATEFIESIIPYSLEMYIGLQPELGEDCEDDCDHDHDDDESDEEDEEDDKKKKKHHKKSGDQKSDKPAQECKQQ